MFETFVNQDKFEMDERENSLVMFALNERFHSKSCDKRSISNIDKLTCELFLQCSI